MPKSSDVLLYGVGAVVAFFVFRELLKPKLSNLQIAETSSAQSSAQAVTPTTGGPSYTVPYVEQINSPYTTSGLPAQQIVTVKKLAPLINDPSKQGLVTTSLTVDEYANLSFNDKRALEKGYFSATNEGLLITGWDRLLSLLPFNNPTGWVNW